jgi:hypothetical protein
MEISPPWKQIIIRREFFKGRSGKLELLPKARCLGYVSVKKSSGLQHSLRNTPNRQKQARSPGPGLGCVMAERKDLLLFASITVECSSFFIVVKQYRPLFLKTRIKKARGLLPLAFLGDP